MVPDFLTIAEAGVLIAKRELSPVELVRSRLTRIERLDGRLNSFIRVLGEEALAAARSAEAEIIAGRSRGPLHGIPIGLKDIYETKGVPTTGHSKVMIDHVPREDATSVRRLTEAGAIVLGKLATHEFAFGGPSRAGRSADRRRIAGLPASSRATAGLAGRAYCRSPSRSTMPARWRGLPKTARSCCRRWPGTTPSIRRARSAQY